MKRALMIYLILVLLISVPFTSLADIDKEIVFNGIPWEIDGRELIEKMEEKGIHAEKMEEASMPIWTYDFRNDWQYYIADTGYYIGSYSYNNHSVKIAGFDVDYILQYAYYDVIDGKLNKPNCHYYMTHIVFEIENELVARGYNELKGKLSTLYGEGKEISVFMIDTDYTYTVWKGANSTATCLYMSEGDEYNILHLLYGKTDCEEILKRVREAYINSIPLSDPNDFSGL